MILDKKSKTKMVALKYQTYVTIPAPDGLDAAQRRIWRITDQLDSRWDIWWASESFYYQVAGDILKVHFSGMILVPICGDGDAEALAKKKITTAFAQIRDEYGIDFHGELSAVKEDIPIIDCAIPKSILAHMDRFRANDIIIDTAD